MPISKLRIAVFVFDAFGIAKGVCGPMHLRFFFGIEVGGHPDRSYAKVQEVALPSQLVGEDQLLTPGG